MKRALLLLLPAVLLVFLSIAGCNDETEPTISRLRVYPACGVVPMPVEALAIATGGNESGDPTGGNNNLDITWNFGDGTTGGTTSIAYHTYQVPGNYTVVATAQDPDGKTTSMSQLVRVMADTLTVEASSNFPDGITTVNDTVRFDVRALSCDVDPDIDDDYRNLSFNWGMDDSFFVYLPDDTLHVEYEFTNRRPTFLFDTAGTYEVTVSVTFPALATTRYDTVYLEVTD